jgi:hypothetical protein
MLLELTIAPLKILLRLMTEKEKAVIEAALSCCPERGVSYIGSRLLSLNYAVDELRKEYSQANQIAVGSLPSNDTLQEVVPPRLFHEKFTFVTRHGDWYILPPASKPIVT